MKNVDKLLDGKILAEENTTGRQERLAKVALQYEILPPQETAADADLILDDIDSREFLGDERRENAMALIAIALSDTSMNEFANANVNLLGDEGDLGDIWKDFPAEFLEPKTKQSEAYLSNSMSANMSDSVRAYLNEIGRKPRVTAAGQIELAKRIEAGLYATYKIQELKWTTGSHSDQDDWAQLKRQGAAARQMMIETNLGLVVSRAKRFSDKGLPLLDLIQEGNDGLIHAIEKFDHSKGFAFSTYAVFWIEQRIKAGIKNKARQIRIPISMLDKVHKMLSVRDRIQADLGRSPTTEEIAKEMGVDIERIEELVSYNNVEPTSLNQPADDDRELGDILEDRTESPVDDVLADQEMNEVTLPGQFRNVLETLTPRQQEIVRLSCGFDGEDPMSNRQIAEKLEVTDVYVRKTFGFAMERLRRGKYRDELKKSYDGIY